MLGGGVFVTQDKILPGAYINVVSAAKATANLGERGVVAIALPLTDANVGEVIEITSADYITKPKDILGEDVPESTLKILDEVFKHATRVFIYNAKLGDPTPATKAVIDIGLEDAVETGGIVIKNNVTTVAEFGANTVNSSAISQQFDLTVNDSGADWSTNGSDVIPGGATLALTAKTVGALDEQVKTDFNAITNTASLDIKDGTDVTPATNAVVTITLNDTTPTTGIVITGGTTTIEQLGALTANETPISTLFTVKINDESKDWESDSAETVPASAKIELTAIATGALAPDIKSEFDAIGDAASNEVVDGVAEIPGTYAVVTITLKEDITTTGVTITGGKTTIGEVGNQMVSTVKLSDGFTIMVNDAQKDWTVNSSEVIAAGASIKLTSVEGGQLDPAVKSVFDGITNAKSLTVTDGVEEIPPERPAVTDICAALEPYEFNVIAAYTSDESEISEYVTQIKAWRDDFGKKCQVVVYNADAPDYEGVINVKTTVSDEGADPHALVAWVAGAEAGCAVNASCTNMNYDGSYKVVTNLTQSQLEDAIENGEFVFHIVYGEVHVLEDINSLTTVTEEKSEDFKNNQNIRVVDQIANDIAKLFNVKYLGKIPNDKSGRTSLWGDIVKHHRQLESIRAIQEFDASLVTVEQGETKKSVVVNDVINPVNAMSQLYMTIVVQ